MRMLSALLPIAMLAVVPVAAQTGVSQTSRRLSSLETLWQLRSALNVAALNCRDSDNARTVDQYNAMIASKGVALAAANTAVSNRYRDQFGARWEEMRETDMTRLYNYFAQPTGQATFCASAKQMLAMIGAVDGVDLPGFALAAMPMLRASFEHAVPSVEPPPAAPLPPTQTAELIPAVQTQPIATAQPIPVEAARAAEPVAVAADVPVALPAPIPPAPMATADALLPPQALPAPIPPVRLSALFRPAPPQP